MPFIGPDLYRCECGNVVEMSPEATRCPCECHKKEFEEAKARGLWCEVCDFATLDPFVFQQHFHWSSHQKAAQEKGDSQ